MAPVSTLEAAETLKKLQSCASQFEKSVVRERPTSQYVSHGDRVLSEDCGVVISQDMLEIHQDEEQSAITINEFPVQRRDKKTDSCAVLERTSSVRVLAKTTTTKPSEIQSLAKRRFDSAKDRNRKKLEELSASKSPA